LSVATLPAVVFVQELDYPFATEVLPVRITHMTLAKVAHDAASASPELREVDDGINAFLGDHIMGLREMTSKRKTPPGKFMETAAKRLFRDLFTGPDADFLAAANGLTKRLIAKMDARAAKGLLICLRAYDDQECYGGVLKLQVVAPNAAVLEELASGAVKLSAVRDLLDKPGDLQKGALSTSWLAEDRIMVGDQLGQDAAYFPEAFAIRVYARPATAVADLFAALDRVAPKLAVPVAAALPAVSSGDPTTVLAALGEKVPGLTPGIQSRIVGTLENQARPVAQIDTGRAATETIRIGEIKITGPVSQMRQQIRIEQQADELETGGWAVIIYSLREPRRTYP
jgi:hypothetical protein